MTNTPTPSANRFRFRAFHKTDRTMTHFVFGDLEQNETLGSERTVNLSDCIVMQSTGLTDKNGKEIFEGDIVQTTLATRKTISVIEWEQPEVRYDYQGQYSDLNGFVRLGGWKLRGHLPIAMHEGNCEVIGNVHEHPDLLPSK